MSYVRPATNFLATVALLGALLPGHAVAAPSTRDSSEEVIIKLARAEDLPAVARAYQLDLAPLDQFGANPIYLLHIADGSNAAKKARQIERDARVIYAEPNMLNSIPEGGGRVIWEMGDSSPSLAGQWAAAAMRLPEAHAVSRGAGVTVAVLDTGVDAGHEALVGHIQPGYDFVDRDADMSEGDGLGAAYGHGTAVASLIALAAPEATIVPYRVLDENGEGNMWVLVEALQFAANPDGNPATDDGAQIINLSLGAPARSRLLDEVVRAVTCETLKGCSSPRGVTVVASAGNAGSSTPVYPAASPTSGLLAVAAATAEKTLASFSNYGWWVDIAAPGEQITGAVPGGYAAWSGTSMAAPLIAGEAALIRAVHPQLTPHEVTSRIITSATPLATTSDATQTDRAKGSRFGHADAAAALQ